MTSELTSESLILPGLAAPTLPNPGSGKFAVLTDDSGKLYVVDESGTAVPASSINGVVNAGSGVEIAELPIADGFLRLRSLESTNGSMELTQGSNEIDVNVDTVWFQGQVPNVKDVGDDISAGASPITLNVNTYNVFKVSVLVAPLTININVFGIPAFKKISIAIVNPFASTIAWPGSFKFPGGIVPTYSGSNYTQIDCLTFDGGTSWLCDWDADFQ